MTALRELSKLNEQQSYKIMHISEFSVKNWQFTLCVFLAVLSIGGFSLLNMPRGEDPDTHQPSFSITIIYPGTSPADMEKLVVDPFEKRIFELENLGRVRTSIFDGVAVFLVEYNFSEDEETKYQELIREINAIRKELPQDIFEIKIQKFSPLDVNIYQFALISENASYAKLETHADELVRRLEKIKSLKNVKSWGFPEQRISVELNLDKMAQDKIPVNRVLGAIQSENVNIPGGSLNMSNRKLNVKTSGEYQTIDEIKNTIVYTNGTKIVSLKDIAKVTNGYEDENHITRLNGHRCVFVTTCQKGGQNVLKIKDEIDPVLAQFKKELPASIDLVKAFDQVESVRSRLARFAKDFGIAILLVLITLIPLGTRASLVVMISIPLSLAIGLAALDFAGYSINQLSIVGMIVSLGILVDDSIVVVENIERFMRNGYSRKQAAIEATKQISLAVMGCTILLCFAFLPVANLPETAGEFIRSLPMAVMFTVLASMFVSLTIVPFLSSIILSEKQHPEGNFVLRGMKKIISATYGRLMDWCLARPKTTIAASLMLFFLVMLLAKFTIGFRLFPTSEKPMALVNIEMPVGTNLWATEKVARYVESELKNESRIKNIAMNVGKGNPRIYYNEIPRNESANYAQAFLMLNEISTKGKKKLIDELREKFMSYPNAKIEVKDFEQGPPLEAPIQYRIFGDNLDTLRTVATQVKNIMAAHPGAIYTQNPLEVQPTDLRVKVNKEKAGLLGVNISDINRAVRMGVAGLNLSKFRDENGDEHNINISLPRTGKNPDFEVFNKLFINNALGTAIPLKQLAEVNFESSPNQIRHLDKDRFVPVSTFLRTGYNTSKVNNELKEKLNKFKFPKGFYYTSAGEEENAKKSFGGLGVIITITIFGMIAILILEFGNLKSTIIVLSVIPLGIVGAILALILAKETLSFVAVIGFIALIGIEVKNSLLLVDYTNQLREQGMGLEEAIHEAGETRFVPILLTSFTAIGGLIPLVIEYSDLYSPLALVLIGGITSSTLLARLVTPVMYKLMPPKIG